MKKMKKILALAVWIAALGLLCASCDNGLDIQQAYTFSLETMPVQKRISVGETGQVVKTSFTFQSENGTEETER